MCFLMKKKILTFSISLSVSFLNPIIPQLSANYSGFNCVKCNYNNFHDSHLNCSIQLYRVFYCYEISRIFTMFVCAMRLAVLFRQRNIICINDGESFDASLKDNSFSLLSCWTSFFCSLRFFSLSQRRLKIFLLGIKSLWRTRALD